MKNEATIFKKETQYDGDFWKVQADEDSDIFLGIYDGDERSMEDVSMGGHEGALILTIEEAESLIQDLQSAITEAKNYENKGEF